MKTSLIIIIIAVVLIIGVGAYWFSQNSGSSVDVPANTPSVIAPATNNPPTPPSPPASDAGTGIAHQVEIKNFAYSPLTLNVKAGDTVRWTNMDSVRHTVTSDSGSELDSALLADGETYSHTFTQTGSYAYHCTPHPNMKATIIVQ